MHDLTGFRDLVGEEPSGLTRSKVRRKSGKFAIVSTLALAGELREEGTNDFHFRIELQPHTHQPHFSSIFSVRFPDLDEHLDPTLQVSTSTPEIEGLGHWSILKIGLPCPYVSSVQVWSRIGIQISTPKTHGCLT